jgi:hypothetical protein
MSKLMQGTEIKMQLCRQEMHVSSNKDAIVSSKLTLAGDKWLYRKIASPALMMRLPSSTGWMSTASSAIRIILQVAMYASHHVLTGL